MDEERPVHQDLGDGTERKRRHGARFEAGRVDHLIRLGDAHELGGNGGGDRGLVGAAVARDEREDERAITNEDKRLHDLR